MKRLWIFICIFSMLLTGCSIGRNSVNLSPECYRIAKEILEITDDYLDGRITAVIAAGQIQGQCRTLGGVPHEEGTMNQQVTSYCEILSYNLALVAEGELMNERDIIATRNTLADLLGEKTREK